MRYRAYGLVLDSTVELAKLETIDALVADLTFQLDPPRDEVTVATWHWHQLDAAGEPVLAIARRPGGYLLRFPGSADFVVERGDRIHAHPCPGTDRETIEHLLLDQVVPRIISAGGATVLHASGILVDEEAVAFAAPSGGGKSTLAHAFGQGGARVLSDDALVLRGGAGGAIEAVASYGGVRLLRPRDRHRKTRERTPFAPGSWPLRRIFVLEECDEVSVRHLGGRDAVMALTEQSFYLDAHDPSELQRGFETNTALANRGVVRRLRLPKRRELLPEVQRAVFADLQAR